MRIFLVGGAVRDMLLGLAAGDRDYLVLDADPAAFSARFPAAKLVGKAFPVFILEREEYAFARGDGGLESDLLARDFTVNALAVELPDYPALPQSIAPEQVRFAHPDSLEDLRRKVLRPASPFALAEDPLRVFRAARFLARFPDFTPHPALREDMRAACAAGLLPGLAAERVGTEARKALRGAAPGRFLRLLAETGCLGPWFAELEEAADIPAGPAPHHDESLLEHLAQVLDRMAGLAPGEEIPGWMALAHDLGKGLTPRDAWPRHIGHEKRGAALAEALGRRLALPEKLIRAGALAAREHMLAARYPELRPGTRVDLLAKAHAAGLMRELFLLARADHGVNHAPLALADLAALLAVRLPADTCGLGEESGRRLRELRAEALAKRGAGQGDARPRETGAGTPKP
jgi:tRNA nucleotidyltransferase (CCA-adding enzyme)